MDQRDLQKVKKAHAVHTANNAQNEHGESTYIDHRQKEHHSKKKYSGIVVPATHTSGRTRTDPLSEIQRIKRHESQE